MDMMSQSEMASSLLEHCRHGRIREVRSLFKALPDASDAVHLANACDVSNTTALLLASRFGHLGICAFLMQRGANVNAKSRLGWSRNAFYAASLSLSLSLYRQYSCFFVGNTPLHWACAGGFLDIVKLLLSGSADINARNCNGDSVLLWACSGGNLKLVRFLVLEKEADICEKNREKINTLMCAVSSEKAEVVSFVLKVGKISVPKSRPTTSAASLLLNEADSNGNTALHIATSRGYTQCMLVLLKEGADIHAVNDNRETPASLAEEQDWKCREAYHDFIARRNAQCQKIQSRLLGERVEMPAKTDINSRDGDTEHIVEGTSSALSADAQVEHSSVHSSEVSCEAGVPERGNACVREGDGNMSGPKSLERLCHDKESFAFEPVSDVEPGSDTALEAFRYRALCRHLNDMFGELVDGLSISPEHALGSGLDDLSASQMSFIETMHQRLLSRIELLRLKRQEREALEMKTRIHDLEMQIQRIQTRRF